MAIRCPGLSIQRSTSRRSGMQSATRPVRACPLNMQMGWAVLLLPALMLLGCARNQPSREPEAAYARPDSCRSCHTQIAESYQHVAMSQSLYRPTPGNVIEDYRQNNHFY